MSALYLFRVLSALSMSDLVCPSRISLTSFFPLTACDTLFLVPPMFCRSFSMGLFAMSFLTPFCLMDYLIRVFSSLQYLLLSLLSVSSACGAMLLRSPMRTADDSEEAILCLYILPFYFSLLFYLSFSASSSSAGSFLKTVRSKSVNW